MVRGRLALALVATVAVAGCGGGERQDADEAEGTYRLEVVSAKFPEEQRLAETSKLRIEVRNADDRVVPHMAVTVETVPDDEGDASLAFGQRVDDAQLADPGRPIWIVNEGPEGGEVAHTNTWAIPRVGPGETAEFVWDVTAVKGGEYTLEYSVYPGLDGKAKLADDDQTSGSFDVSIDETPPDSRVNADGEVVRESN